MEKCHGQTRVPVPALMRRLVVIVAVGHGKGSIVGVPTPRPVGCGPLSLTCDWSTYAVMQPLPISMIRR
jgi:hypothetical protein